MVMQRLHELMMSSLSFVATTSVGQVVFKYVDRVLYALERTCLWSISEEELNNDANCSNFIIELKRPLPWSIFIPTLLFLRIFKGVLNFVLFIMGRNICTKGALVNAIRVTRRKLRAIKSTGIKAIRQNTPRDNGMKEASKLLRSLKLTISALSCLDGHKTSPSPPPTRIRISNQFEAQTATEKKSTTEPTEACNEDHDNSLDHSKRKFCDITTDDGNEKSDSDYSESIEDDVVDDLDDSKFDEDYDPANDLCTCEELITTDSDTSISSNELNDLKTEAEMPLPIDVVLNFQAAATVQVPVSTEQVENSVAEPEGNVAANNNPECDVAANNNPECDAVANNNPECDVSANSNPECDVAANGNPECDAAANGIVRDKNVTRLRIKNCE